MQSELKDKGEVSGQIRNFFMNTNNGNGQSHYANAIGAVVKYESPSFYGFRQVFLLPLLSKLSHQI